MRSPLGSNDALLWWQQQAQTGEATRLIGRSRWGRPPDSQPWTPTTSRQRGTAGGPPFSQRLLMVHCDACMEPLPCYGRRRGRGERTWPPEDPTTAAVMGRACWHSKRAAARRRLSGSGREKRALSPRVLNASRAAKLQGVREWRPPIIGERDSGRPDWVRGAPGQPADPRALFGGPASSELPSAICRRVVRPA